MLQKRGLGTACFEIPHGRALSSFSHVTMIALVRVIPGLMTCAQSSSSYSMYGVIVMFLAGVACYFLVKAGYPSSPMILSFVLAKLLESNMRKAFILSRGSLSIFFTRPITLVLMLIFFTFIGVPLVRSFLKKGKKD